MDKRVKVYDDEEGIYRFEEADTDEVRQRKTLNDGTLSVSESILRRRHGRCTAVLDLWQPPCIRCDRRKTKTAKPRQQPSNMVSKEKHEEGLGSGSKQSAAGVSSQTKVDTTALLEEAAKFSTTIKELSNVQAVSVEAAQHLGQRLQAKSRSLAKKPGNTEAVALLHDVNSCKKQVNAVVAI